MLTGALAVQALSWTKVYRNGGGVDPVLAYGAGYHLWVAVVAASSVALAAAALIGKRRALAHA